MKPVSSNAPTTPHTDSVRPDDKPKSKDAVTRPGARPIADQLVDKLRGALSGVTLFAPGGTAGERAVEVTSITAGENGSIDLSLRSGGGFAKVSLTQDGAKFTLNTPAFLNDRPMTTTQNVLTFDIDFSDLSPAKHAGLIEDLASALESADAGDLGPAQSKLLDSAKDILDQPKVARSRAYASVQDAIKDLFDKVFGDAPVDDLHDCRTKFKRIVNVEGGWTEVDAKPVESPLATLGAAGIDAAAAD